MITNIIAEMREEKAKEIRVCFQSSPEKPFLLFLNNEKGEWKEIKEK